VIAANEHVLVLAGAVCHRHDRQRQRQRTLVSSSLLQRFRDGTAFLLLVRDFLAALL